MQLGGIHHITAVTGNASHNVAFYTQVLGMRLTKKTVNQDDVSAYHLFYGDELGRPGTDLTFFEWPDVGYHRPGVGTISTISLGVTGRDALNWWVKRFNDFHVAHEGIHTRGADDLLVLPFRDPEGQHLELVDDAGRLQNTPWRKSPVPVEMSIHGFSAVRLTPRGDSSRMACPPLCWYRWRSSCSLPYAKRGGAPAMERAYRRGKRVCDSCDQSVLLPLDLLP